MASPMSASVSGPFGMGICSLGFPINISFTLNYVSISLSSSCQVCKANHGLNPKIRARWVVKILPVSCTRVPTSMLVPQAILVLNLVVLLLSPRFTYFIINIYYIVDLGGY
eukprot:SAG11_NODE_38_length_21705_cov_24.667453_11_plen_111_part_00